jgi:hypothetical protein
VCESGIHDVGIADAENQFVDADSRKKIGFAQQPVIGGAF